MGDSDLVQMGVCNVEFDSSDIGYTKGGVTLGYSSETITKEVDQEDAPIDEKVSSQSIEVTVPLAESDLSRLSDMLPGATYTIDGTKKKMVLSGAAGVSLLTLAKELVLKPVDAESANDWVTLKYAAPRPQIEYAYDKENVRVWNVVFKAMIGDNGWVVFGDETASNPVSIEDIEPSSGDAAGGDAIQITGYGFTGTSSITINSQECTGITVISDKKVIAVTPANAAGTYDVVITATAGTDTATNGFTTS